MAEKRFLTVTDLAKRLGRSRETIYVMERENKLPPRIMLSKRRVWFGPTIDDWERRLVRTTAETAGTFL